MKAPPLATLPALVVLVAGLLMSGCDSIDDLLDRSDKADAEPVAQAKEVPAPAPPPLERPSAEPAPPKAAQRPSPPAYAFPASGAGSKLIVGAGRRFEPMYDFTSGKPRGYDVDLILEMAQRLGKSGGVDFRSEGRLLPRAAAGEVDLAIGALSIREERLRTNSFSRPYLVQDFVVIAHAADVPSDRSQLAGRSCALGGSGIYKGLLEQSRCRISEITTTERAIERVAAGLDAFTVVDSVYAGDLPPGAVKTRIALGKDTLGIALQKGNISLKEALDVILDDLDREGFLDALRRRHGI